MSFCRSSLIAAATSLFLSSGALEATDYFFNDPNPDDAINVINEVVALDDGICSFTEAMQAINFQEASDDCEAGTGVDKIFLEEGKTFQLLGPLTIGGGTRDLNINADSGDTDYDDSFLALVVEGEDLEPDVTLPIIDGSLDEAAAGIDFNRDGDLDDTFKASLIEEETGDDDEERLDYNEDGDFLDSFSDVFYEGQYVDAVTGRRGIDINGDGRRNGVFKVVEEFAPEDIFVNVTIEVERENALDDDIKVNPILLSANDQRIFNVEPENTLNVQAATLEGAVTSGVSGDGGLIHNQGRVTLSKAAVLQNGSATGSGGAIYLASDTSGLSIDNVSLLNNSAGVNGGAIAMTGTYTGAVAITRMYAAGNQAAVLGGVIHLNGSSPRLTVVNSTFYNNTASVGGGAAIRLDSLNRSSVLSNITVAGNNGGSGISFGPAGAADDDVITNSVLVGNVGGSCADDDAGGANKDLAHMAFIVHDGSADPCPADVLGFVEFGPNPGDVISNQDAAADFSILRGVITDGGPNDGTEGACPASTGSADCAPLVRDDTETVQAWIGFLPAITNPGDVPTLIDSGAPVESTGDVCTAADQRDIARETDCDPGAFELRIGKGLFDEISVVQGVSTLLDVTENDRGDLEIDCTLLLPSEPCMTIDIPPAKGTATVELDASGRIPYIRYQSDPSVHGVDGLRYVVQKGAVVGGRTFADSDMGAQVILLVEPASGLTKSESIGSGLVLSILVLLAGLLRRRGLLAAICLFSMSSLQAATIQVNSLSDIISNDGQCTLREAIRNATDDAQLPSPDCAFGVEGRDTVLLPSGTIILQSPLDIPEDTLIDIVGVSADLIEPGAAIAPAPVNPNASVIQGSGTHRLIVSRSSMRLINLTLENGFSADDGGAIYSSAGLTLQNVVVRGNQGKNGGAIYLNYQTLVKRTVRIEKSYFFDNSATLNGGVLSMVGQNQDQVVLISGSAFVSNSANGVGGALDINLFTGGSFSVINSTFESNDGVMGADAMDLGDVIGTAYVVNSTFVGQDAAIDLRNGPASGTLTSYLTNSVYFFSGGSGTCSTGTAQFNGVNNVVFGDSGGAAPDPSCAAAGGNDMAVTAQDPAALLALLGTNHVNAAGEGEDYIPAFFEIDAASGNAGWLVDQGNGQPSELIPDFGTPSKCRTVDVRGQSRAAGGVCDIGAYEVQVATAVDDEGDNVGKRGQFAIIDVLENDVAGEGNFIVPYAIDLNPAAGGVETGDPTGFSLTSGATVRLVVRELEPKDDPEDPDVIVADPQLPCGGDVGTRANDERCVIRYEAPPLLSCVALENFTDTFEYAFVAYDQQDFTAAGTETNSLPGEVTVRIANVPPRADNVTISAKAGETVVFPLDIEDPDAAPGSVITLFQLSQNPLNATFNVVDGKQEFLYVETGSGNPLDAGIIVDPAAGTVTYIPRNVASPFDDTFTLRYEDACGGAGATTFTVDVPNVDNSGDIIGGSLSVYGLLGWCLLLLGRRRRL